MNLDINGMQAFLAIAEHGSFIRGAAVLNITQTAISHRLRKFEENLGVQLIERTTRHVQLTKTGTVFLPRIRNALKECSTCVVEIKELSRSNHDILNIGCLPTLSKKILIPPLEMLRSHMPNVIIRLFDSPAPMILDLVLKKEIEFGVSFIREDDPRIIGKSLIKSPIACICSVNHPFASRASIEPIELCDVPLIRLAQDDVFQRLIEERFVFEDKCLVWHYQVQQAITAIRMAGANLGVAILPAFSIDPVHDVDVVAIPIAQPRLLGSLGIIRLKDNPLSIAALKLQELIEAGFSVQSV